MLVKRKQYRIVFLSVDISLLITHVINNLKPGVSLFMP